MPGDDPKSEFWNNIILATEAEPRGTKTIQGASGFTHPVVALGVDENRRRVVLISGEGDARAAAMAQGDIQAAMPNIHVVMARPAAVNLGQAATIVSEIIGRVKIGKAEIAWLGEHGREFQDEAKQIGSQIAERITNVAVNPFSYAGLNLLGVWKDVIQQLSLIEIEHTSETDDEQPDETQSANNIPTFDLRRLIALDPVEADRHMGVCSIPLYELSEKEVEDLHSTPNVEQAKQILKRHDIFQYFFPAADQLALGLVEREPISPTEIVERLSRSPDIGHPFGALEIIDQSSSLPDVINELQGSGLLVEGEAGIELTPGGRTVRAEVRFKPREGLLEKLSRVLSIKVDIALKDIFKQ